MVLKRNYKKASNIVKMYTSMKIEIKTRLTVNLQGVYDYQWNIQNSNNFYNCVA